MTCGYKVWNLSLISQNKLRAMYVKLCKRHLSNDINLRIIIRIMAAIVVILAVNIDTKAQTELSKKQRSLKKSVKKTFA